MHVFNKEFNEYIEREGRLWRRGYTTGSCAAAAAKGAVKMLMEQQPCSHIDITTPLGYKLTLELTNCNFNQHKATCSVVKDSGDDFDITHGSDIYATVSLIDEPLISIKGGIGVGKITKPGLALNVGEPAINPVPREMITAAVREIISANQGVEITIEVPNGLELAKKTLNPELGIVGGISILGTTGIVEPMSEDAFKVSLAQALKIVQAENKHSIAFTPGKIGQRFAYALYGIEPANVIQTSNFIGFMLEEAVAHGVDEILLIGHIGKLIKIAAGNFNTHNRVSDGRRETLAAHAAALGAERELVIELMNVSTAEEGVQLIKEKNYDQIFYNIAAKASERAEAYSRHSLKVGTVLLSLKGEVLGFDQKGINIGGKLGCNLC
ncbi:MAG: cobalt-precorrin-5B (C(1))-methyltransferase CbiD [Bacillota bacterium]|nr:cobalt-precorrin-5B (C(1))-methyltransferase CbiD [Bacillota bacterium]